VLGSASVTGVDRVRQTGSSRVLREVRQGWYTGVTSLCRCLAETRHARPCHFGGGTVWRVRVQASPQAVQLIQEQGGKLYVRAQRSRCCHGSLTFLGTSNEPAKRSYRRVGVDEIELYLDERLGDPEELVIEARGRRRKRVHAYWDGCAYVV
jgi:hypothetical protein